MSLENRIRSLGGPLETVWDLDPLIERVGDARFVLLGEASHGTSQFYGWRTEITCRLIAERGFSLIGIEWDWPDCWQIHRWLNGPRDPPRSARDVLRTFERWPAWMWANREVEALLERLRALDRPVGFHGLDVYSLADSLRRVADYLQNHDPGALPSVLGAFECLELGRGLDRYAWRTRFLSESCESELAALLAELRRSGPAGGEDWFDAEQNALVARNAERYYRTLLRGGGESWNVRDRHMTETLERLVDRSGPEARAIVWAHNTHVGDARFTDMADAGMINLGQLIRERRGREGVVLVGFGSYEGTAIAGRSWGAVPERMRVPPARQGSWEEIFHRSVGADRLLLLDGIDDPELLRPRGHRAIGVVYRPEDEEGNYVPTVLPRRYDAFLYLDRTDALTPLAGDRPLGTSEAPETFPTGM